MKIKVLKNKKTGKKITLVKKTKVYTKNAKRTV